MFLMTRVISVVSGKGGVGKTFLTANLGIALAEMGKDVTIIDGNLTTPNLGLHLGIPMFPNTLHDVLKGKTKIHDAVYEHESGLRIVPAGLSINDLRGTDPHELPNAIMDLLGSSEIILIDAAAGLGKEALASMESSDETILVTNPELPSVLDVMKASRLAKRTGAKINGIVINRYSGKKFELGETVISGLVEAPVISRIPESIHVKESIAARTPVVKHNPNSPASIEIKKLAAYIVNEPYEYSIPWHKKILGILFG